MSALARMSVLACGQAIGVAWSVAGGEVTLFPIGSASHPPRAHEMPIDGYGPGRVVHCDVPLTVAVAGQSVIGTLSPADQCRLAQCVTRAAVAATMRARWEGEARRSRARRAVRSAV